MFSEELAKALLKYQIKTNCTLISMARMCGISSHKMGYLMGVYNTEFYKQCDSVKVDAKLEDGLRRMGIRLKVEVIGEDEEDSSK